MSLSGEPLAISLVAHTVFCPRRAWLEAQGERVDSAQIEAGQLSHRAVDDAATSRSDRRTSVEVHHEGLGIAGRCDVLRMDAGEVQVVEYKATPVRRVPEVTLANRVQLACQAACLQEMGYPVSAAGVQFTQHNRFVSVSLDAAAFAEAADFVAQTREIVESPHAPPPLVEDPRCRWCSHASVCLPDEADAKKQRSTHVSDPDGEIVHVTVPGSRVHLRTGRVLVVRGDEQLASLPLERIVGLVLHGNIDVSSGLLRELLWRHVSVVWCSGRGRVVGWASSADGPNGAARVSQCALSQSGSLPLATAFITAKISNQATQLRRHGAAGADLGRMRELQRRARGAHHLPELFGIEGEAASIYFDHFPELLSGTIGQEFVRSWQGRSGRRAKDPLNAALNFTYALLVSDCIRALVACGLDPHGGFLHSSTRNKPALALDLMEEFRTPVAESAVVRAINNGELRYDDFSAVMGDARLRDRGRRALLAAYEQRVAEQLTHPIFGKVSWRRAMEVQARMMLGFLDGSRPNYVGLTTR